MNAEKFREITKGHFFTVVFEKKDGSIRTLNGLDRVKSYLKGGKPVTDGRVIVWDRKAFRDNLKAGKNRFEAGSRSYRSFWPEQVIEIHVNGKIYTKKKCLTNDFNVIEFNQEQKTAGCLTIHL